MKSFVSIKSKLLYLLLASILLTLALVGISLDFLIERFYQGEANKGFSRLYREVAAQLLQRENALLTHAQRISEHDDVISVVNMINQYATPEDYQPLVYDGEKQKLALELREEAKAGNIDVMSVYDARGTMISFFRARGKDETLGYLSYENKKPVSYLSNGELQNHWVQADLPATIAKSIDLDEPTSRIIHYHRIDNGIAIQNYRPIKRAYPNGTRIVVGYVAVEKFVTQSFTESVSDKVGLKFGILLGAQQRIGDIDDITVRHLDDTKVISTITGGDLPFSRSDSANYFTATSSLLMDNGRKVYLLAAMPKEIVASAISDTRSMVILVLLMAAAIILPIGILVANKTISIPLGKLAEGVEAVQKGLYGTRVSLSGHDELNALANAFNSMSISIDEREAELVESENKYRNLVDNLPQSIFFKDRNSVYVSCNQRYADQLDIIPSEIVGKTDFDFFTVQYAQKYRDDDARIIQQGEMEELEEPYEGPDGVGVIQTVKTPVRDPNGEVIGILGIFWDISDKKQAEKQLRQSAAVFESTADGVIVTDVDKKIIAVNKAFTEISGYSDREALGRQPSFRRSERQNEQYYIDMWASIRQHGRWQGEIWNRRKSGEVYPEWMTISTVRDADNNITNYVAVFSDITNIKRSQSQLDHMAHHDPLTDLPNRTLFDDRLSQAINRARRHDSSIAILFIDLDRFKNVNDTLGHPVGDVLLQDVAKRLLGLLREQDTVARLGGDEFIILIEDMDKPDVAEAVASKVIDAIAHPFTFKSQELYIGASIGISIFPDDGDNAETLIKYADAAMYRAKEQGRNTYQFYTQELTKSTLERLELEAALRRALERNELELYYQPQIDLSSGAIIGAEALLRWHHPELGMVPPDKFIPLAEENGLIVEIGHWVLQTACKQAVAWSRQLPDFKRIAVNLSGVQVQRGDIVDKVQQILEQSGLQPNMLELEITESVLMHHPEIATQTLGGLRELGVELAIDDFGTGYSSLSYLKRFPIQLIKIDRAFVMDIPNDANDTAITRAVIALGKSLQLKVIAEGVETKEQEAFLIDEGCDIGQGYYYSRPLPLVAVNQLMAQGITPLRKS